MADILQILNSHYPMRFTRAEFLREGGNTSYAVFAGSEKYFLRVIKPMYIEGAVQGADIQAFLGERGFPVPPILFTEDHALYVSGSGPEGKQLYILYEFIEGGGADPERDAEALGALVGRLHRTMKDYPGALVEHGRHCYIGKYIGILREKQYPRTDEFAAYGEALWEKVRDLPRGYCHGDMYDGNFHKTPGGEIYVLDFDTSGEGVPIFDPALICNKTHYFKFHRNGYARTRRVFERFLPEYLKHSPLSQAEIDAFYDMIALYRFALQARVIEDNGIDCVDDAFLDRQLDWLYRWRKQCGRNQS